MLATATSIDPEYLLMADDDFGAVAGVLMAVFIGAAIFWLIFYVINAIALQGVAKREGSQYWWFAWVPILNAFLIPMLVKDDAPEPINGDNFVYTYLGAYIGSIILSGIIPFVFILTAIFQFYAFYLLAKRYSHSAVVHTVFAVVTLSASTVISLFMFKKRIDGKDMY